MPKTHKIKSVDLTRDVMAKIKAGQVVMKPRWYFVAGTILSTLGLAGLGIVATFLVNLTIFLLKKHGPNGQWRLQQIIESFPLWVPILAIIGMVLGIGLLKKYDFSYKKNFWAIILVFVVSIFLTAFLLDYTGLNNIWMKKGPMQRFYQNSQSQFYLTGPGQGWRNGSQSRLK